MGLILSASAVYVGVVEFLSVIDRIQRSIKFANEHKIESEAVEKLPYSQIEQDSAEVPNQNPVEFERLAEITYQKSNVSFEEDKSNYVTTDAVAALENSCTSGPMPAEGELTFESESETCVSEESVCEIDSCKSSYTNENSNSKCPESVEIVVKNENQDQIRDENENNIETRKIPGDLSEDISETNSAVPLEKLESTSELSSICDVGESQNEMQTADPKEPVSDKIENRSVTIDGSMEIELGTNSEILEKNKFTLGVTDENAEVPMQNSKNDIDNTFHDDLARSENIPQCKMKHEEESAIDDKPRENDVQDEIPKREGNSREAEGNIEHGNGSDVGRENGSDIGGGTDVSIESESHFARGSGYFKTDCEFSTTNSRFQENENICSKIDANLIEQCRTNQYQKEHKGVASRVDGCSNGVNVMTDTTFEENSEGKHLEEKRIADNISTASLKPQQVLKLSTIEDKIYSETSNQSSEANESINSSNSDEGQSDSIDSKDVINNERATCQSEQRVNNSVDDNSTSDSVIDNVPNTQVSSQLVSDQIHTNICNDFGSVSVNNENNSVHSFESDKDSCDVILDANAEEIVNNFPEPVENNSNNLSGIGKSVDNRFIDSHSHFTDDPFNSVDESCDHNKTNVDTDDHSTESSLLPLESNNCPFAPNAASNSVRYPESSKSSDSAAVKSSREAQEISKDSTPCSQNDSQISVVRPPENEGYETQPMSYSKNERQRTLSPSEATSFSTNDRSIPGSPFFQGPAPRTICENDISESISPNKTFEDDCSSNAAQEPSDAQSENQQKSLIFSGEYTKAMNKDWHSGHFCCWQCDESLTGKRYVLRDEHPYCIKCYESVFANPCEECNKIIGIDSKDLSYKDKHWHESCFLCNKCRVSLVDKQFGSKVEKIYCGSCYDAQFASRCDGCGEIFRAGTKKMEYKTRQWHEKCFSCVVCKTPIGTKSFIPREQEIFCAGCYEEKFATRCVKCTKIITSGGVTYKNEPWHRECFVCTHCSTSLAGQRFTSRDDKPYCADCFGELFAKRCTACSKPITGIGGTRFISFEDRHWHNDCFICATCKTSLVGRGFITDAEDIICPECAKQKLMSGH